MPLTSGQIKRLLTPVRPDRVEKVRGQSYVPQFEIRAELSRVFGFGNWDSRIHDMTLIYEEPEERDGGKVYWKVCYRAACTLTVRDYNGAPVSEFTEWHAEESAPQPSRGEAHALAVTSVESYALRRAAINLGDTFGLHLYRDGQAGPLIKGTLQTSDPDSPMFDPEAPGAPKDVVLTDEQRATLAASLGAVEIPQEAPEGVPA
jgi:Rad52/22 family double-strand break repair protein